MSRDDPSVSLGGFVWATCALAVGTGLTYAVAFILPNIDGWLYHMTPLAAAANASLTLLLAAALALTAAMLPVALGIATAPLPPPTGQRIRRALLTISAGTAALLLSLTLLQLGLHWARTVAHLPEEFARLRYTLIAALAVCALAVARRGAWGASLTLARTMGPTWWIAAALVPVAAILSHLAGFHWASYRTDVAATATSPMSHAAPVRPNIVLITFDALSNHDTGLGGYALPTTPTLDALAAHSTVFGQFYSGSTFTTPAIATILTGRHLPTNKVFTLSSQLPRKLRRDTIPYLLRAGGYLIAASVANERAHPLHLEIGEDFDWLAPPAVLGQPLSLWLMQLEGSNIHSVAESWENQLSGLARHIFDKGDAGKIESSLFPPEMAFAQAEKFLKQAPASRPFFLWVHVLAPHSPYRPRPPFRGRFLPGNDFLNRSQELRILEHKGWAGPYPPRLQPQVDRLRLRYDEWVAQCDAALADFIVQLKRRTNFEHTVLMVSADHGESFEGGYLAHRGANQYPAIVNVPLLVHLPGQIEPRRPRVVADQTSLLPTILDLAGLPVPDWAEGPSLRPALEGSQNDGGVAYTYYLERVRVGAPLHRGSAGVIEGHFQYVLDLSDGKGILRDLSASGSALFDPVQGSHPTLAAKLRRLVLAHLSPPVAPERTRSQ